MAAGGDDDIAHLFAQHALIFGLDDRRADGGLLHLGKAELLERIAHRADVHILIIGNVRRRKAHIHRVAALDEDARLFPLADDLLGILRAGDEAAAAQDTLVSDDMRLIAGETDRLHRAMTDTFIAVLTVGLFERQTIHAVCPPLLRYSRASTLALKNSSKRSGVTPVYTSSST